MAIKTKDGKREFTNASQARKYDRRTQPSTGARQSNSEGVQDMHDEGMDQGAPEETQDFMDNPDGEQMAQEHGPAQKVTIQHDPSSGVHHVMVDHPDGHTHQTQHGTAAEAHDFAKACAGGGGM